MYTDEEYDIFTSVLYRAFDTTEDFVEVTFDELEAFLLVCYTHAPYSQPPPEYLYKEFSAKSNGYICGKEVVVVNKDFSHQMAASAEPPDTIISFD